MLLLTFLTSRSHTRLFPPAPRQPPSSLCLKSAAVSGLNGSQAHSDELFCETGSPAVQRRHPWQPGPSPEPTGLENKNSYIRMLFVEISPTKLIQKHSSSRWHAANLRGIVHFFIKAQTLIHVYVFRDEAIAKMSCGSHFLSTIKWIMYFASHLLNNKQT